MFDRLTARFRRKGPADEPDEAPSTSIKAYSQRLMPPFSGQVQIVQSSTYRAITLDAQIWELQYIKRSHVRVGTVSAEDIRSHAVTPESLNSQGGPADDEIVALLDFLVDVKLPFPATDRFEYWLLDKRDHTPLALTFSCSDPEQMVKFPERPEWTALPAAVMPIEKTLEEDRAGLPPVNYRLERLVAERAGQMAKGRWFDRDEEDPAAFPALMVSGDWPDEAEASLYQRYIERQAPRLLMLHSLTADVRARLESYCRPHAMEVARFHGVYPEIIDEALIRTLRVEAQVREATGDAARPAVHGRRDGILYI